MIFCLSQVHVGTWSTLAWLVKHKEVNGLMLSTGVYEVLNGKETPPHAWESGTYHERWDPMMVYHEHIRRDHFFQDMLCRSQMVLASINPTVIPIRDPLLALISYHHRAMIHESVGTPMFMPIGDVLDRWCFLAEQFEVLKRYGHIRFLCWDLLGGDAKDKLWSIAKDMGFKDKGPSKMGPVWDNQTGEYPLKKAYADGDMTTIRLGLRENGFQELKNREKILRPFLEDLGYRNLMWWSRW